MQTAWTPATFDLSAFAGKTIQLRFRYRPTARRRATPTTTGLRARACTWTRSRSSRASPTGSATARIGRQRLDPERVLADRRDVVELLRPLLRGVEPGARLVGQYLKTGPYNFGFPDTSGLGRALPVPERAARQLLGHVVLGQQRERRTPVEGEVLPIDANPRPIYRLDGKAVARPGPDVRRAVLAREERLVHPARAGDGPGELHPRPGRRADVRRPARLLVPGAADRGREGAQRAGVRMQVLSGRTGPRCGSACRRRNRVGDAGPGREGQGQGGQPARQEAPLETAGPRRAPARRGLRFTP